MRVTSCPDDFGDYCFLEGTIDLEGSAAEIAPQPAAGQDHLVLALDCSGSMAGSPYKVLSPSEAQHFCASNLILFSK